MTKRPGNTSDNAQFDILKKKQKSCGLFCQFIKLGKLLDEARGTLWIKFTKDYFETLQMKSVGLKKNFMAVLKSATLAILPEIGWEAGLAMPC